SRADIASTTGLRTYAVLYGLDTGFIRASGTFHECSIWLMPGGRGSRVLSSRSTPECRPRPDRFGCLRRDTGLSVGPDHSRHLLERLDPEHGPHLRVAHLVAAAASTRQYLRIEALALCVGIKCS